eukprot:Skav226742  [mRNA]  locus=scaffold5056:58412:78202:+ [translate_table: standard]
MVNEQQQRCIVRRRASGRIWAPLAQVATESKTKQEEVKARAVVKALAAVLSQLSELDGKLTSANKDLEAHGCRIQGEATVPELLSSEDVELRTAGRGLHAMRVQREAMGIRPAMKYGIQILQKARTERGRSHTDEAPELDSGVCRDHGNRFELPHFVGSATSFPAVEKHNGATQTEQCPLDGAAGAKRAEALQILRAAVKRSSDEELQRLLVEAQGGMDGAAPAMMQVQSRLEGDGDVAEEVDMMLEKQLWKLRDEQKKEARQRFPDLLRFCASLQDEKWQWCLAETSKTKTQKTSKERWEEAMESLTNGIESAEGGHDSAQRVAEEHSRVEDGPTGSSALTSHATPEEPAEIYGDPCGQFISVSSPLEESKNEHQLALRDAQKAQEALSGAISTLNKFYQAPETWSGGFKGTGQAETKSQEAAEEASFDKEMTDAKKEKAAWARLETEKSSQIRDMSEKKKMTDRSVSLLAKYSEDPAMEASPFKLELAMAQGHFHTVLLRSDGSVVACGPNSEGQCEIPTLDEGTSYTQVSAGNSHTVLLRSDGNVVACGANHSGQCDIPALEEGTWYIQVSAGDAHTVLLRSDGQAVACGKNWEGQCDIPPLEEGAWYTQVFAGDDHTVLLRSDGKAVACGDNCEGQCDIPALEERERYIQVSASDAHTVLLRSDGKAVACGDNSEGQCEIPTLDEGTSYTEVSAGDGYTVLLCSDDNVIAFGSDEFGESTIPTLDEGMSCTNVSAGHSHTVLLRSDGTAIACGRNQFGQCNIPIAEPGVSYISGIPLDRALALQLQARTAERKSSKEELKKSQELFVTAPLTAPLATQLFVTVLDDLLKHGETRPLGARFDRTWAA